MKQVTFSSTILPSSSVTLRRSTAASNACSQVSPVIAPKDLRNKSSFFGGKSWRPDARSAVMTQSRSFQGSPFRVNCVFAASSASREQLKQQLLDLVRFSEAGALVTDPAEVEKIEEATRAVEAVNPTVAPTSSAALGGVWRLVYTTSDSILGRSRPSFLRPKGPIYQIITLDQSAVENRETIEILPFLKVTNRVEATFTVDGPVRVQVKFNTFYVGPIPIKAGENARGFLDTTYLDDNLRISRGNRNNLFVLVKD
mmetsp:Transcript_6056/g.10425  ORF Transcript_6056/g.10425 Transcript_6056/m.10425 type:complete len:256 (+) Transcript_6056:118-885(+)|eukprot:CAMPEP_0196662884 /NCGR_PEP_ID=MMETSP1086-20130531/50690_1 /TAXON_ID=77921 /ORGANISM="Cyanoptyche  gloeocystis , Strain SAG4.97" /LENGTH=255 /DNA_ID=CAMNT_0041998499 /DNA_START=105 /DNA_END=872 /DNA_ORIENTATION=+